MNSEGTYSSKQAASIVGLTYRQVDHWIRSGFLLPEKPANGSGSRRGLSTNDLMSMSLAKAISNAGVPLVFAFESIKNMHEAPNTAENEFIVISDGEPKLIQFSNLDRDKAYRSIFKNGKVITAINVSEIRENLDAAILAFNQTRELGGQR